MYLIKDLISGIYGEFTTLQQQKVMDGIKMSKGLE
jgi:hypothetical protein